MSTNSSAVALSVLLQALLDDTDAALQHSLHHARKSKAKAKEIHGRYVIEPRSSFACCILLMLHMSTAMPTLQAHDKTRFCARRSRIGFCKMCMTLLFVGCAFVGMYMFIRVTYFVGFKQ